MSNCTHQKTRGVAFHEICQECRMVNYHYGDGWEEQENRNMLCTHKDIMDFIQLGFVKNTDIARVNATSLDVVMGDSIMVELGPANRVRSVDLLSREGPELETLNLRDNGYVLYPGEFILAQTQEEFNMPDYLSAEFKLKSSLARMGLEHLTACWIDPGFHNSVLTLELKNMLRHHRMIIRPGQPIGQVVFYRHDQVHHDFSYRNKGRYNNERSVRSAK